MLENTVQPRLVGGPDYAPLTDATIRSFLRAIAGVADRLGGPADAWTVREVGDGNLNLVFIVKGVAGGLVIKQALPYVRLVGESWPLPLDRVYFEQEALRRQARVVPSAVPQVFHFDAPRAAMVMELLEPHIILRKGLIQGTTFPRLASDMAQFCARTLYASSDFALPAAEKRAAQALFSRNVELCKITEDLVFTDPYRVAELNRWTSPQLDAIAAEFRADAPLKVAVQELKWMFLTRGETLLHGDLHTGSVMVTPQQTRVIDPEFACVGPMGFDLGAFMANLLLAYFSQEGLAAKAGASGPSSPVAGPGLERSSEQRHEYSEWILDTLAAFWTEFESTFEALWRSSSTGDAFVGTLFEDPRGGAELESFRHSFMARLFADSIGFAGAKMARRILGLAHVEDLESIADPDLRARCELKALRLARMLMVERGACRNVGALVELARQVSRARVD